MILRGYLLIVLTVVHGAAFTFLIAKGYDVVRYEVLDREKHGGYVGQGIPELILCGIAGLILGFAWSLFLVLRL